MAGMVGKKAHAAPAKAAPGGAGKAGGGANGAKPGHGAQVAAAPAAGANITYVWVANAGAATQTILTFSQPVVWNGSLAVNWRLANTTTTLTVEAIVVNTPTQVTITWSGNVNAANMFMNVPQTDPTFKGGQGQFVQSGKQSSGPQK